MVSKEQPSELIEESIRIEQNVAALYLIFSESLPEDADFWHRLHLEETSHARLIRDAKDAFLKRDKFPYDLIAGSVEELKISNTRILSMVDRYRGNPPTRREACEAAIQIENESGESHYARFMDEDSEAPLKALFQQLNRQDRDHEKRIRERMDSLPTDS